MYQELFTYNFLSNFLISTFFLTFNIIFSYSLSNFLKVNKIKILDPFQPVIIFVLIFSIYSSLFNMVIISDAYDFFNVILYTIILFQILFLFKNFKFLKKFEYLFLKSNFLKRYIIFVLILFFLISILPISDADSISLHQNMANEIYLSGLNNINLEKNISYTIFSNTQSLLILSPILKSDNFGSQLNLFMLAFFILLNIKKNEKFAYIIFACPLIIYFISAQKLQLFFGIIYLLIFIIVNKKLIKNKIELFITILLLAFYASGNLSYILFSIPLYIYIFYQYKKYWNFILIYSLLSFLIILFPIFLTKQIYFSNIFAPFLDNIFGSKNFLFNAYAYSVKSTDGWIGNPLGFELFLKPFISFNINKFSSSLGIIFLLMICSYKTLKKTNYFPLIIIFLVLATGQILPRYYFEAFLLLAYYYKSENQITKLILIAHNFLIVSISIGFLYFAYLDKEVLSDKKKYMNKFSYTFYNSQQQKKMKLSENVLDFGSNRPSTFYDKNYFSMRTLNVLNQFEENNEKYLINFIKKNSINYLIIEEETNLPSCIVHEKIGVTNRKTAVRNFLRKQITTEYNVLKIISNKC